MNWWFLRGKAVLSQARRGRKENEHECCWDYVLFTFTTFTSTYFIGFFFLLFQLLYRWYRWYRANDLAHRRLVVYNNLIYDERMNKEKMISRNVQRARLVEFWKKAFKWLKFIIFFTEWHRLWPYMNPKMSVSLMAAFQILKPWILSSIPDLKRHLLVDS